MFGKKARKEEPGVELKLPITPMLDMTFQLLAFFIMTFKETPREGQIPIYIPAQLASESSKAAASQDQLEEKTDEIAVEVTSNGGNIQAIAIRPPAPAEKESLNPQNPNVEGYLDELRKRLTTIVEKDYRALKKNLPNIRVEVGPDLKYGELMRVMDRCKLANPASVGPSLRQSALKKG